MVVMGMSEKRGGSLYMGQWIIDAEGQTVAQRRKLKPTHVERTVFGEGDGSDLAVLRHARSAGSARCAAGSTCSRSPSTRCTRRTSRCTSRHGRASRSTAAAPTRSAPRSTTRPAASTRSRASASCSRRARRCRRRWSRLLCGTDPTKQQLLLRGRRLRRIYAPDGQLMLGALAGGPGGPGLCRHRPRDDLAGQGGGRPGRPLSRPDVTRLLLDKTPGDRVLIRTRAAAEVEGTAPTEPASRQIAAPVALRRIAESVEAGVSVEMA